MTTKEAHRHLLAFGFDLSQGRTARCSQCEALCINGHPTHETGCPNAVHECDGCNALIPARQRFCEDCSR